MARFDRVADRYDAFCATPLGSFVDAVNRHLVGALLDLHAGNRVADLDCGTGTWWMADPGCHVAGVDESAAMLGKARSKRSATGPWAHHYRTQAHVDPTSVYHGAQFWTLPEIIADLGREPAEVGCGLYVGPRDFCTVLQAWAWESRGRRVQPLEGAEFLALRFDAGPVAANPPHPQS